MKILFASLPGAYLGFSLSFFAGLTVLTWQFWTILIPTTMLFSIYAASDKYSED